MTDTMYQKLTLDTPFHKLKTKYDILLYIKYLITKLNTINLRKSLSISSNNLFKLNSI